MADSFWSVGRFLAQTDVVGWCVLGILAAMSFLSWYLILSGFLRHAVIRSRSRSFISAFCRVRQPVDAERLRVSAGGNNPFSRVLFDGIQACLSLQKANHAGIRKKDWPGFEMVSPDDYVSAALAHGIARENRSLESGMAALASIASTAPFVGLFGTVWGIFHALQGIALSAQASLDKVAGPVGEALVMTACGLFVSIPALLAYNVFARLNRNMVGDLERFAHDVFGLLGLGLATGSMALGEPQVVEFSATAARGEAKPKAEGAH